MSVNGDEGSTPRRYGDEDISGVIKDQRYLERTLAEFRTEQREYNRTVLDKLQELHGTAVTVKLGIAIAGILTAGGFGIVAALLGR